MLYLVHDLNRIDGSKNPDEQKLLENFDKVISVYLRLDPAYASTIDIFNID